MKARYLKNLLQTKYNVHDGGDTLNVGSPLSSQLFTLDKKTFKIRFSLDTFDQGRKSVENDERLLAVWDGLQRIVDTGEIHDILAGNDEYENGVPVFYEHEGEILESVTDEKQRNGSDAG